jgi:hypothetical protein
VATHKTPSKSNGKGRTSKALKKAAGRVASDSKRSAGPIEEHGDDEVTIDRRRSPRRVEEAGNDEAAGEAKLERRKKVNRRRQIDPTTCERDYNEQEIEFMNALDDYKRKSGRMFPTCSEVLEVIQSLGYVRLSAAERNSCVGTAEVTTSAKPMPNLWPAVAEASTHETGCGASGCDTQFAY